MPFLNLIWMKSLSPCCFTIMGDGVLVDFDGVGKVEVDGNDGGVFYS